MKRIYIAGPVTGVEGYEENFARAEQLLRDKGYEPVNPVAPGLVPGKGYRFYINRGLRMLEDCDAICLLPGWTGSRGTKLEKWYAETVMLPILYIDSKYTSVRGPLV